MPRLSRFTYDVKRLDREFPWCFLRSFRHAPLSYHKRAYASARAAECVADQGKFAEYHDVLFTNQAGLDTASFERLAREAHAPDLATFASCARSDAPDPSVERDKALAFDSVKIRGRRRWS